MVPYRGNEEGGPLGRPFSLIASSILRRPISPRPGSYGAAYWICKNAVGGDHYCVDVDIGAPATSVLPASVRKIRAIYR